MLTQTGHGIEELGRTLTWDALHSFLSYPRRDSALVQELDYEVYEWETVSKTNAILADIFDLLANINASLVSIGSGKKAKQPERYPRPGDKKKKKFSHDALPEDEMRTWFEEKRKKRMEVKNDV